MTNRDDERRSIARPARLSFAALVVLGLLLRAGSASALGPVDVEVAVKGSYGTGSFGAFGAGTLVAANGLGFGVGGRAGAVYKGAYAGLSVVNYAGEELQAVHVLRGEPGAICNCGPWVHLLLYGGELGYGITLGRILTLRPLVGIGNTLRTTTFPKGDAQAPITQNELYVKPAISALVSFGPTFAGLDLGVPIFAEDAVVVGFTVDLQAGFRL